MQVKHHQSISASQTAVGRQVGKKSKYGMVKFKLKKKNKGPPQADSPVCPSLTSDSSEYSNGLANIELRSSSLDVKGLLNAVNMASHYASEDEESIQESPTLECNDSFGPLQFQNNQQSHSFSRVPAQEPLGPVTGSNAPMLAPKLAPVSEQPTINFAKQVQHNVTDHRFDSDHHAAPRDDDDDELPFAATKQMASTGRARSMLPEISTGIVMTNDKFETYRKSLNSLQMLNRQNSLISNAASEDEGSGDEDEEDLRRERKRKQEIAKTRQQQEAHLSVHRQKMNKMVGGTELSNTMTLDEVEQDDDDIMEDVPLSILRAHGFPKAAQRKKAELGGATTPTAMHSPNHTLNGFDGTHAAAVTSSGSADNGRVPLPPVFNDGNTFSGARGLVGEIAREEEAKRNRGGRTSASMFFDGPVPRSDSRNSLPQLNQGQGFNPILNDIRAQMQQMSQMQAQIMHMTQNEPMSAPMGMGGAMTPHGTSIMMGAPGTPMMGPGGYSRPASIRSFGAQPYSAPGFAPHPFSPGYNNNVRHSAYDFNQIKARPIRSHVEEEDDDDDEAWKKFAEKRQSLKAEWIATGN